MSDPLIDNLSYISCDPTNLNDFCFSDEDLNLQDFSWYNTACISMKGISCNIISIQKSRLNNNMINILENGRGMSLCYKQKGTTMWEISKNTN